MSEEQLNAYRLTSMEEPGDERLRQIMCEVAEEARISNALADNEYFKEIVEEAENGKAEWASRIEELDQNI